MRQFAYNAGVGWLRRERRGDTYDPETWDCLRTRPGACEETRGYVRRIRRLRPLYRGRSF